MMPQIHIRPWIRSFAQSLKLAHSFWVHSAIKSAFAHRFTTAEIMCKTAAFLMIQAKTT